MRIVLHLGAHKTASTHLQLALGRAQAALAEQGVALFLPDALRRNGLRLGDYLSMQPEDRSLASTIRQALAQAARNADCLLITEENILGNAHQPAMIRQARLYPSAQARLERLAGLLPDAPVTLALSTRQPGGFLTSAYSQRLMSGRIEDFETFRAGLDPAALSWHDLVARLHAAIPAAPMVLWRYEDYPAIAAPVLTHLLGEAPARAVRPGPNRAHPGLTAPAHAALMAEAAALSAQGEGAIRERVRALRQQFPREKGHPPLAHFDAATEARCAQAYQADHARIAALPFVVTPGKA